MATGRCVLKGAFAGFIGGLAGAAAKAVAEQIYPPRMQGQTPPPGGLAEDGAGHPLDAQEKDTAKAGIHWVFGAMAGAVYGAIMEYRPTPGIWKSAAFGITVNKMTHKTLLPAMGLAAPVEAQPAQERVSEWVSHAVYGVVTESVRSRIRRQLP